MTDPMTPLTDESEALLAGVHGTQMALTVFPARLRAIEQAAARRAIEGMTDVLMERDMAEAYYPTLQRHLREHGCTHDFADVANADGILSPRAEEPLTAESELLLGSSVVRSRFLSDLTMGVWLASELARIEAAAARRALEGSGVVHEPVLFDPTGPVYDSLPHPKASRYELSGALLRDQSADPLADPDAYDRRILLVTVASAARALAALPHPEEPRVERCAVCGVGRWVTAHDPEAGPSHHPFAAEAR